jgi:hypothetical protein
MNRVWLANCGIINIFVLLLLPFASHSQQYYTVVANSGINLRAAPSIDSEIIGKVPFGTWLIANEAIEEIFNKEADNIDGRKGIWTKVLHDQKEVFAFSGYLLKHKWYFGESQKDRNLLIDEYDIYLNRKLPETINTNYKLIMPGFTDYKNFDPNIHWYAIIKKEGEFYLEKTNLQMIPTYEYFTLQDEKNWHSLEGPYIYNFECPFGADVDYYIGSDIPLTTGKITGCKHDIVELPKLIHPDEKIRLGMGIEHDAWIYAYEENIIDHDKRTHEQIYQLGIFDNYVASKEIIDLMEYSLFRYPAKQHIYKKASTIEFIGDLNHDGICDFIMYFTDGIESCGMQFEYQLFMSDANSGSFYLASNSPRGW